MGAVPRPLAVVLTLACPDRPGIVAAVATALADHGANITESQQFGDPASGRFFLRMTANLPDEAARSTLTATLAQTAHALDATWQLLDARRRARLLVLVSRQGHCLADLLWRTGAGPARPQRSIPADIVAVASNHLDLRALSDAFGVPYHYLPVDESNRNEQEAAILRLVRELSIDLVVLARYMQVLSASLVGELAGRAINIHHSFLPSFSGPRPYHQAHARGVKLIGATAHYVTADLDAGPIIEQEVARVDHRLGPGDLTAVGQDLECLALARAVRWHCEQRVLVDGQRTIVFA
jgi:formyltetrahydrofolate deformylase